MYHSYPVAANIQNATRIAEGNVWCIKTAGNGVTIDKIILLMSEPLHKRVIFSYVDAWNAPWLADWTGMGQRWKRERRKKGAFALVSEGCADSISQPEPSVPQ